MTISQLSPLSAELLPQDLDTLRDYALEAPWEWQQALFALIEAYEEHDEVATELEKAEEALEDLRDAAKDAIKEIRTEIDDLIKMKIRTEGSFKAFEKVVLKTLDDLEKASDEPKPAPAEKMEVEIADQFKVREGESVAERYAKLRYPAGPK